ncbi:uncharacterized protein [Spinacia oleracea]|uniref:Dynein light chain n=1 Tax=Spinacia oleracea TaxID=3562 RepID=A0ABM3QIC4_SPIOL|nr:uncharacterized protein LOC110795724 [Spinacia oleracea]
MKPGTEVAIPDRHMTTSERKDRHIFKAAKESRFDKEAVTKFFRMLIRRRYFSDRLPPSNPWSVSPIRRSFQSSDDITSCKDQSINHTRYSIVILQHRIACFFLYHLPLRLQSNLFLFSVLSKFFFFLFWEFMCCICYFE